MPPALPPPVAFIMCLSRARRQVEEEAAMWIPQEESKDQVGGGTRHTATRLRDSFAKRRGLRIAPRPQAQPGSRPLAPTHAEEEVVDDVGAYLPGWRRFHVLQHPSNSLSPFSCFSSLILCEPTENVTMFTYLPRKAECSPLRLSPSLFLAPSLSAIFLFLSLSLLLLG